jgi:hypothetical protein
MSSWSNGFVMPACAYACCAAATVGFQRRKSNDGSVCGLASSAMATAYTST